MSPVQKTLFSFIQIQRLLSKSHTNSRTLKHQASSNCSRSQRLINKDRYYILSLRVTCKFRPGDFFLSPPTGISRFLSTNCSAELQVNKVPDLDKSNIPWTVKCFLALLNECANQAHKERQIDPNVMNVMWDLYVSIESQEKVFLKLDDFNLFIYILKHYDHKIKQQPSKLIKILDDIKEVKLKFGRQHYNTLIQALGWKKDLAGALMVFLELQSHRFPPNGVTFDSLMDAFLSSFNHKEAMKLYRGLKDPIIPQDVPIKFFIKLLKFQCDRGYLKSAISIYKDMIEADRQPSIYVANVILSAICEHNDLTTGLQFFRDNYPPNAAKIASSYNILLTTALQNDERIMILQIWKEMVDNEVEPDIISYTLLMRLHLRELKLREALDVYTEMLKINIIPDSPIFRILVQACVFKEEWKPMLPFICEEMKQFDFIDQSSLTYNIVLKALTQLGIKFAQRVMYDLICAGLSVDSRSPKALIEEYVSRNDLPSASQILQRCQSHNILPDQQTYEILIRAYIREGNILQVQKYYSEFISNNNRDFPQRAWPKQNDDISGINEFLKLCSKNKLKFGIDFFEHIQKLGFKGNTMTYTILVQFLLDLGRREDNKLLARIYENASTSNIQFPLDIYNLLLRRFIITRNTICMHKVFEDMMHANLEPDSETFRVLVDGFNKFSEADVLEIVYDKLKKSFSAKLSRINYNGFIYGFCRNSRMNLAYKVYTDMRTSGLSPDVITFSHLINGYASEKDIKSAHLIFSDMPLSGIKPTIDIYQSLINGYINLSLPSKAIQLYEDLAKVQPFLIDNSIYHNIISACLQTSNFGLANELLNKMEKDTTPSKRFTGVIIQSIDRQDLGTAIFIFEHMVIKKIEITLLLCQHLVEALSKHSEFPLVRRLYRYLVARKGRRKVLLSMALLNSVIKCASMTKHTRYAKRVLEDLLRFGFTPSTETMNAFISGPIRAGHIEEAKKLMDKMRALYNIAPNTETFSMMINSLVHRGQLGEAMAVLRSMKQIDIRPNIAIFNSIFDGYIHSCPWRVALRVLEQLLREYPFKPDIGTANILCEFLIKKRSRSLLKLRELYNCLHGRGMEVFMKNEIGAVKEQVSESPLVNGPSRLDSPSLEVGKPYQDLISHDKTNFQDFASDHQIFDLLFKITKIRVKNKKSVSTNQQNLNELIDEHQKTPKNETLNEIIDLYFQVSKESLKSLTLTRSTYVKFLKAFWKYEDISMSNYLARRPQLLRDYHVQERE
ncbi:hypothetical protein G9A89_021132 [Geosiphon pyriformis]|nr:hypothetical protein G9A89_021132 [Geosiphon pyriformis]